MAKTMLPKTAMPGMTAKGYRLGGGSDRIPAGEYTAVVYSLIQSREYEEVISILSKELQAFPTSRAALSLTAYCHYSMEDFGVAAMVYERLTKHYPEVDDYKLAHAQALFKAGQTAEASRVVVQIEDPAYAQSVLRLQACIKFEEGDVPTTKALVEQCIPEDPATIVNQACLLYKEGRYEDALRKFHASFQLSSANVTAYNIALCYYRLQMFNDANQWIGRIISNVTSNHSEFPLTAVEQGLEVRHISNSVTLHNTALVQAFNLKCAMSFGKNDLAAAREVLRSLPPRREEDLDPVTLHNLALVNMEADPTGGFEKLRFLLASSPCPPETIANLLLLYCKYQFYDLAADVLTEYAEAAQASLAPEVHEFVDATIIQQSAPEEAFRRLDELAQRHVEHLRRLIKAAQTAVQRDADGILPALRGYSAALEQYLPVLMAQARIFWDREAYAKVESILFQSVEFFYLDIEEDPRVKDALRTIGPSALDSELWKLNLAHVFFMQPGKHEDAIKYYEPIVRTHASALVPNVTAIVLANLCVAYILATRNDVAEEVIRRVEKEEAHIAETEPERPLYHSCIINLVIGTLYCAKGHFEFGIGRVIKSFEPIAKKLNADTWFYAKRCLLAVLDTQARHTAVVPDQTFHDMVAFLEAAEAAGGEVQTVISFLPEHPVDAAKNNVAYEARQIKRLVLMLRAM